MQSQSFTTLQLSQPSQEERVKCYSRLAAFPAVQDGRSRRNGSDRASACVREARVKDAQ